MSASRRTDIPAWYSDWFFRRLREGYALARHPMDPRRVSRVRLDAEAADGFVFWTKNPAPMMERLSLLDGRPYVFQFTLTAYGREVERGLPSKRDALVPTFLRLSDRIGPARVLWRYDPIFLSETYTAAYHLDAFERLARRLAPYTALCTIGFFQPYRAAVRNLAGLGVRAPDEAEKRSLAAGLSAVARGFGLRLAACAEPIDLSAYGVARAMCVDAGRLGRIAGTAFAAGRAKGQRAACGCAESVDIGAYHTCLHGCRYCYAVSGEAAARRNAARHDPASPLLVGRLAAADCVTERAMRSVAARQTALPFFSDGTEDA